MASTRHRPSRLALLGALLGGLAAPGLAADTVGTDRTPPDSAPDWAIPDARVLARAIAAASAEDPAAPTLPRPPALPVARPLVLRVAPALTTLAPDLVAALRRRTDLTVTEASGGFDHALDTLADFPLDLYISRFNRSLLSDDPGDARPEPLGNLELNDYAGRLEAALQQRIWRLRLAAVPPVPRPARQTTTCLAYGPGAFDAIECDLGAEMATLNGQANLRQAGPESVAVRNDAAGPRHLYLIDLDPRGETTVIPLGDGTPTAPGQWAVNHDPGIDEHGDHQLITLSTPAPIAPDLLAGRNLPAASDADCGTALTAWLCGRAPGPATMAASPAPRGEGSVTRASLRLDTPQVMAIGGGFGALPKDAPWIAQIYSTVPYTEADFAKDDLLPPDERQYLRARRGPGLAHRCGGTQIAERLILTAAHCVAKGSFAGAGAQKVFSTRRVRLWSLDLGRKGKTFAIDGMVIHAGYSPDLHRRDIALLHLAADRGLTAGWPMEPVAVAPGDKAPDEALLPAAGADAALPAATPVNAYGWGFTGVVASSSANAFVSAGLPQQNPDRLQVGPLQVLAWPNCFARMGNPLDKRMLCAVTSAASQRERPGVNVFSCVGDSGGPLVRTTPRGAVLVGVTAWSRGCGMPNSASVYTDIATYREWIATAVARIRSGQILLIDDALKVTPLTPASPARR